jgi:hypothetical protein
MKLKTILQLSEWISHAPAVNANPDSKLRPVPGGDNDTPAWDGIVEGRGWFLYRETNDWNSKRSGASVYITEGEPYKFSIKVKTHGLRKGSDTNESYNDKVKKHTDKVGRAWVTAAKKIHNNPKINEVGNEIPISWTECFREALEDPRVKKFISHRNEGKIAPMCDPVNFTPRLQENTENTIPPIIYFIKFWYTGEDGVEEDAVQDFHDKDKANKFVEELLKKKKAYDLFVEFPPDNKIYDSRDQKGHEHIGLSYAGGGIHERFK